MAMATMIMTMTANTTKCSMVYVIMMLFGWLVRLHTNKKIGEIIFTCIFMRDETVGLCLCSESNIAHQTNKTVPQRTLPDIKG